MASLPGIPAQYNKKSSAVKRIMQEARELVRDPSTDFSANPLETDIFEWHFTIRGPEETEFEGGLYHGRILLPNNYPFAPPSLMFLTPNGRFELHKKVCLSITGYHPEYWQPAWGIRTVLVAVMGFLPTQSKGAIGGLDTSVTARKTLAIKSKTWTCPTCKLENVVILPDVAPENAVKASLKADEMPPEFSFGYESDKKKEEKQESAASNSNSSSSSDKAIVENRSSESSAASNTTQNSGIIGAETETTATTATAATTAASPQDPPRETHVMSPAPPTSSEQLRTSSSLPIPPSSPQQSQTHTMAQPLTQARQAANSNSPIWLDALILGFGGLLLAMVIRRFL
ncbi:hypothetical protein BGZ70_004112 [Mortierella alpina]|uniref:UBC core domain-containing protein n=1 Tax=Mortierella alpina TaxID=64518 RepID=A0A9P6JA49_MORAP|nr:hypothetical protein BGZ70_004112 [Mortierella alpina]